ncbi:MAG: alpha/beta hydrolase [Clostridiaceae bacterium]|nr:alpha/beta hydrolase [Clostridiaceae bacterium]
MNITKETFIYKEINDCTIKADVYFAKEMNAPVILYIHGGALIWGNREYISKEQVALYHEAGFHVISIDYRLAPETKLENIIEDIQDAVTWVKTHCQNNYGFDSDKMAVVGSSAGGYLSLMTGTFINKPKAIVSFYGYGDIVRDWYSKPSNHYLQKPIISKEDAYSFVGDTIITEGERERYIYYLYCRQNGIWTSEISGYTMLLNKEVLLSLCPLYKIGTDYPPTLLLHGDQDQDVPFSQSVLLEEKLNENNVENKFITLQGKGHDFDYDMEDLQVRRAFDEVIQFLKKYLEC